MGVTVRVGSFKTIPLHGFLNIQVFELHNISLFQGWANFFVRGPNIIFFCPSGHFTFKQQLKIGLHMKYKEAVLKKPQGLYLAHLCSMLTPEFCGLKYPKRLIWNLLPLNRGWSQFDRHIRQGFQTFYKPTR